MKHRAVILGLVVVALGGLAASPHFKARELEVLQEEKRVVFYDMSSANTVFEFGVQGETVRSLLPSGMPAERDEWPPQLRLYGDGRLLITPNYVPGQAEIMLSKQDMKQLLNGFIAKGLLDFDANEVLQHKQATIRSKMEQGDLSSFATSSENTTSTFRLILWEETGGELRKVDRQFSWVGLELDAQNLSEIKALQDLAIVDKALRSVVQEESLVPMWEELSQ